MRKLVAVGTLGFVLLAACSKGSSNGSSGGGGSSDFASILAETNAAKYKVTYKSGSATPFTIAQDPPRFSYTSGDASTYVTAAGSVVTCSLGGGPPTSGAPACTAMAGAGDSVKQGLISAFGAVGALLVSDAGAGIPGLTKISRTSAKSIAGRDAICATIDAGILGDLGAGITGSYSVCLDRATGAMLESKSDDGKGHVADVKATAFSTPTDADVTPPAKPISPPSTPLSVPDIPSTPST